jgi:hypothetical protein
MQILLTLAFKGNVLAFPSRHYEAPFLPVVDYISSSSQSESISSPS